MQSNQQKKLKMDTTLSKRQNHHREKELNEIKLLQIETFQFNSLMNNNLR